MNRTIFTINIIQNEQGQISVTAEAAGDQPEAYEIGIEIMASLKSASITNPQMNLRVQPLNHPALVQ